MAEFCPDCWNRINGSEDDKKKYVLSKDLDLCEGCGEWKHVIIRERNNNISWKFVIVILVVLCIIMGILIPLAKILKI